MPAGRQGNIIILTSNRVIIGVILVLVGLFLVIRNTDSSRISLII